LAEPVDAIQALLVPSIALKSKQQLDLEERGGARENDTSLDFAEGRQPTHFVTARVRLADSPSMQPALISASSSWRAGNPLTSLPSAANSANQLAVYRLYYFLLLILQFRIVLSSFTPSSSIGIK